MTRRKRRLKRWVKRTLLIAGTVVVFGAFGNLVWSMIDQNGHAQENTEISRDLDTIKTYSADSMVKTATWDQDKILRIMNEMTHQKVVADEKWGAIQMTKKRIDTLIAVVENNKQDYEQAYVLLEILHRWKDGDFSQIVQDHNTIWDLQDGTKGKATDVMSKAEEAEFIKVNF